MRPPQLSQRSTSILKLREGLRVERQLAVGVLGEHAIEADCMQGGD
jgi:hypothetical protein